MDYTKEKGFWLRLKDFVSNVQANDPMSEEEKHMLIDIADIKLQEFN